jgi:hypothetical protein
MGTPYTKNNGDTPLFVPSPRVVVRPLRGTHAEGTNADGSCRVPRDRASVLSVLRQLDERRFAN